MFYVEQPGVVAATLFCPDTTVGYGGNPWGHSRNDWRELGYFLGGIPALSLMRVIAMEGISFNINNSMTPSRVATQVAHLRVRDAKVRAHEAAHIGAGGGLVEGGPRFTFERGPDGRQYAVAGEVSIDTAPVAGNPEATLVKARRIAAAALAPADPSAQDQRVAGQAQAMAASAELERARRPSSRSRLGQEEPLAIGSLLDFSV